MNKWSAHMLTGMKMMTRKMRAGTTCRPEVGGPACRRGEARGAWRVTRISSLTLSLLLLFSLMSTAWAVSRDYQVQKPGCFSSNSPTTLQYLQMIDNGNQSCNSEAVLERAVPSNTTWEFYRTTKSTADGGVLTEDTFVQGASTVMRIRANDWVGQDGTGYIDLLECSAQYCDGGTVNTIDTVTFSIPDNGDVSNPDISGLRGIVRSTYYIGFRVRILNNNNFNNCRYEVSYGDDTDPTKDSRYLVTEETACSAPQPTGFSATFNAGPPYRADLAWTISCADTSHYIIHRDGEYLGETSTCTGSYADYTVQPNSNYTYEVYGYSNSGTCQSNLPAPDTLTTGNCTDGSSTTLSITTPSSGATVNNSELVQVRVSDNGSNPFQSMEINYNNSYFQATDAGSGRWEYTFDTKTMSPRSNDYPVDVTLSARGYDPDCNELRSISQSNTVDNSCYRPAVVTLDRTAGYAGQGATAEYEVTVYNDAAATCGDTNYTFAIVSDSDTTNFVDPSVFTTATITVSPQTSGTTTLQVTAEAIGAEWSVNSTEFSVSNNTGQQNPANQTVTTTLFDADPNIHNSVTTESTKHGSKWGTSQSGARYGDFKCQTCHLKGSGNIKRIRTVINAPNTADKLPGELQSATISFTNAVDTTSDFGDDSTAHVNPPTTLICQYCHTYDASQTAGVLYHGYSMAASASHNNQADCIQCHPHKMGFEPSCTACHNDGIDDGSKEHAVDSNASVDLHNRHLRSLNCADCHGAGADDGSHTGHREGGRVIDPANTTFDTSVITAFDASTKNCTNTCHIATDGEVVWDDATVITDFYTSGDCTDCHAAGKVGSVVTALSQHVDADGADLDGDGTDQPSGVCTHCHPGGADTHKKNSASVVVIPNNSNVDINYSHTVYERTKGIVLGGTQTMSGTATEAEICWNCHDMNGDGDLNDGNDISEWGANTDSNGAGLNFDFGTLNQSAWVGATWDSAVTIFEYKKAQIQSTHAVDGVASSPGLDPIAAIRCSYCHDVHNGTNGDGSTVGRPLLRGTWKGNPYKEDGAPQAYQITGNPATTIINGFNDSSTNFVFGAVPRGWGGSNGGGTPILPTDYTNLTLPGQWGGYWIDQNTVNNPAGVGVGNTPLNWTANNSAGLCALCHGDADGTWDDSQVTTPNEIDQINHFGNAADDWIGTNGHSNAVLGGSGALAANIFDLRGGSRGNSTNPAMAFQGGDQPGNRGSYGFRNGEQASANFNPRLNGAPSTDEYYDYYIWGATVDDATTDVQYHQFSCSKCHNPHASRLPRLMITNCLDTKHNTWDDNADIPGIANSQFGSLNTVRSISNWTSAQNCHRVGGVADGSNEPEDCDGRTYDNCQIGDTRAQSGTGTGWNKVTPW